MGKAARVGEPVSCDKGPPRARFPRLPSWARCGTRVQREMVALLWGLCLMIRRLERLRGMELGCVIDSLEKSLSEDLKEEIGRIIYATPGRSEKASPGSKKISPDTVGANQGQTGVVMPSASSIAGVRRLGMGTLRSR